MTVVSAGQASRCWVCGEDIYVGDPVVVVDDEWVHEECEP